ncbi:hypothetical protein [Aquimarina spongiae]|uniref:Outer membrane protein beta-barrel family protein n=1 Tax=Aquimarina spongiae TaxID=570521 RepID=A0A1M6JNC4_9FLAO|nr:hypothetical protein [Aquimarina spongiae]SHJ48144.1 hypothetical protein SAMN04488508_109157 [Aquimarina spongiae]
MQKLVYILLLFSAIAHAQSLDYETITNSKPFKLSGQISASGVYYNSNLNQSREPYTYFLQGVLNVNIYSFSIPISYSFSNQGENLGYQLPFDFNRLSLHPKYKWITGHIGNVNMTFSPYTLNGHQFTGGGIDLAPSGPLKISAMSGRLLRATEDDEDTRTIPAFNRMGYGIKAQYQKERYTLGIIGFYAKDDVNSLTSIPEEKGVLPQENLVVSIEGTAKLGNNFDIQAEYATTAITKDTRAEKINPSAVSPIAFFFNNRASTEYYNALKTRLGYVVGKVNLGLGYERIDPGYETLGAYFFNNDFENITLDVTNTFFKNKLTLALNIGYQRDDLENLKANNTNRTVGSLNATLALSKRLNITGAYSNFSTFTNIKPNQFDEINDSDIFDEQAEDLDYRQLSQTATLTVNYLLSDKKTARQNLVTNYSLNDVFNEQGGIVRLGDASTFHNMNIAHTINFSERNLSINTSINGTYNTIGREESTTWGPTLGIGKRYLEKTLNTRLSASYNSTKSRTSSTNIVNLRATISYILKEKHNFSLNAIQLFRQSNTTDNLSELTATFSYNYAFGLKKPKLNFKKKTKAPKEENDTIKIQYRKYRYENIPKAITPKLIILPEKEGFAHLVTDKKSKLSKLTDQLIETQEKDKKVYKEIALTYLKSLNEYFDFISFYDEKVYEAYLKLIKEAREIDRQIRDEYTVLTGKINSAEEENTEDIERQKILEKRYKAHSKLLKSLLKWNLKPEDIENPNDDIRSFKKQHASKVFEMYQNQASEKTIIEYIEIRLADLFHKVLDE